MSATLVLVHGGTVTSTMWDGVIPLLRTRALAPDLPGRRYRPADLGLVTRQAWVDAIAGDIVAAGLHDVVLVGHSSGGYVIPGVAAAVPERVRRLVFLAATVPGEGKRPVDYLKPKLREMAIAGADVTRAAAAGKTLGGLRPGEPAIETELDIVDNGPRMGLEAPAPLHEPMSWQGVPPVPKTFIRCVGDRVVTPDLVDAMVADIGGFEVIDIEGGHEVASDDPGRLAGILDAIAAR